MGNSYEEGEFWKAKYVESTTKSLLILFIAILIPFILWQGEPDLLDALVDSIGGYSSDCNQGIIK
jgi:hypothetical protein